MSDTVLRNSHKFFIKPVIFFLKKQYFMQVNAWEKVGDVVRDVLGTPTCRLGPVK